MKACSSVCLVLLFLVAGLLVYPGGATAQNDEGHQFLDGIGETAMIARYLFNGNTNDWSRNNYHAELVGKGATYTSDAMFGSVLSLPGGREGGAVQIPGKALIGVDTISVTGWVYLRSSQANQTFVDFGKSTQAHFYCTLTRRNAEKGFRPQITTSGWTGGQGPAAPNVETGKWIHLAIALDTTRKSMTIYRDGVRVGHAMEVSITPEDILDQDEAVKNLLYIGRGNYDGSQIDAQIHDVRIYSIALSDKQVKTIRNNALPDEVRVRQDLASIDLGELENRVSNLELPAEGATGSAINWHSDKPQFIAANGKVTRPLSTYSREQVKVTLTARAKINEIQNSRQFVVTVPRMPADDAVVALDKAALDPGDLSALTANIHLPERGKTGAYIRWQTSNENIISRSGKVTRPAPGSGNAEITLTAILTYGTVRDTRTFTATVIAMPTDTQMVNTDIAHIQLPALTNVTEYLDLPTTSVSGLSEIKWSSSNEAVLSSKGKVTRPLYEEGSKEVILTVTAVKGNAKASREFEVMVRRLPDKPILADVPDITSETVVGHLPHLPVRIPGKYRNGEQGPPVRVIWPSPVDNELVRKTGTFTITGTVPDTPFKPQAVVTVKEEPSNGGMIKQRDMEPFPLGSVVLNNDEIGRETQFMKNRDKFIQKLTETDPDNFLYNFRDAFGQEQPQGVEPLRGWDSQTTRLRGHASGHYLTAIAQAYASTSYDKKLQASFREKMDYLVDTLYDLSRKSGQPAKAGGEYIADPTKVPPGPGKNGYDSDLSKEGIRTDYWNWGKGFISAYPPDQFILLEQGATYGTRNDQVWAPYYTLHKILVGLLDCYEVGGNEKALTVAQDMGIWVYERLRILPRSTLISMWNRYIAGEYGGMNDVLARLYRLEGDERFLRCAQLFDNISFFFGDAEHTHGLAKNVDTIRGKHANQHIPQITGALETYKGTHDSQYYQVAENFWTMCRHCYMYNIGGVAGAKNPNNAECFTAQPDTLFTNGFSDGGQNETCATYNMLKLSRELFMFDHDGRYMDYYEQAMYNHILASVAEHNAGNTYHVPLNPGAQKHFSNANMTGFTCCNGTALESNTKLQDSIYFRSTDNRTLYVNLYVPSTLTWKAQDVVIRQRTSYPYADTTKLRINGGGDFDVKVRVPGWSKNGFFVRINDRDQDVKAVPGTYLTLSRSWQDGDTIELRVPFHFYLRRVMDQPNIASIFYGPVLLAAEENAPRTTWRRVTLNAADIGQSITGDPGTLRFKIDDVTLKPFYETYSRHSVYMDITLD